MNSLPGNPHYGNADGIVDAVVFSADGSPMQTTEFLLSDLKDATLALAFEQRTANLIAYAAHLGQTSNHSAMSVLEDRVDACLGLREES